MKAKTLNAKPVNKTMVMKVNEYLSRLFKGLKVSEGKLDKHNVFFTDYRVRQGRRIGASRKQLLRNKMLLAKIF